ncbi:single-stranded DNA-binding protein [Actinoplanes sp. NPDC051859]|uniref:single-stranded DNA-binding protein n=1 Tax=Actinoplanes sp. NPDC051859 TaxID=3363909 RepID=UPI0037B1CA67
MSTFNFHFEGNLADDAELFTTKDGTIGCRLRVLHNRRRRTDNGWVETPPMAVAVTAWEKLAENVCDLKKGDTVVVDTRDNLSFHTYQRPDGSVGAILQATAASVGVSCRWNPAEAIRPEPAAAGWDPTAEQPDDREPATV